MKKSEIHLTRIVFGAIMAAIVCVITIFRIPLGQSKVHFANAMCLLSGLLLGPTLGGLAAGLGSAIYDVLLGGYGFLDAAITFVSKFAMAWVTGFLFRAWALKAKKTESGEIKEKPLISRMLPLIAACVLGSLTYVALYMLKTWIFKSYVEPVPAETLPTVMVGKLIPSLINAAFAIVATPVFYYALVPALKGAKILPKLEAAAR